MQCADVRTSVRREMFTVNHRVNLEATFLADLCTVTNEVRLFI